MIVEAPYDECRYPVTTCPPVSTSPTCST
jgi:hypothetical protein